MRGVTFVAMMFVGTLCCFMLGGIALYEHFQFWSDGDTGVMVSDDSLILRSAKLGQFEPLLANVKYVTSNGEVSVSHKQISGDMVKRLAKGQSVPVAFLKSDPQRARFDDEPLPTAWGWLLGGLGFLALSIYAWQLLRKEAAASRSANAA